MITNNLLPTAKIPYKLVRGSIKQRRKQANDLTNKLFECLKKDIVDDYTIFPFSKLLKNIYEIIPDKNFKIKMYSLRSRKYGGITENLYNKNNEIDAIAIELPDINKGIRPIHLPYLIHEFQHVTDQIYNPKYAARSQALTKNSLDNAKYNNFYSKYYYKKENCKTQKAKQERLEKLKKETLEFLKKYSTKEKLDYLQDIKYSMESEIEAYNQEICKTRQLRDLNLLYFKKGLEDFPKKAMFKEKIEIVKEIAFEIIKNERSEHAKLINNKNLQVL